MAALPVWIDPATGYLFMGQAGQALVQLSLPGAAAAGSALTNPMTTAGDLIVGGTGGTPTRLAKGADGTVLTMAAGAETWAAASGGAAEPANHSLLGGI